MVMPNKIFVLPCLYSPDWQESAGSAIGHLGQASSNCPTHNRKAFNNKKEINALSLCSIILTEKTLQKVECNYKYNTNIKNEKRLIFY